MLNSKVSPDYRYIALYCRVSTDEQAREGVSLQEQEERLKAYCKAMGWNVEPVLFIDDGYSAKDMSRPQLEKLIKQVKENSISRVMVTKLDRMSRRLLDLLQLIDMFQQYDVSFISISESFDTNTPSGRLTLQVLGAVAEFERERIRERVFDNMYHAASKGKWLTQSPYGYKLEDKELIINEDEAKIVREVFNDYLEKGLGYYAIAKKLNEQGIPSKQNKEWSIRSIKLMLTNPVYKGTLMWNRKDSSKKKREEKSEEEWVVVDDCLPSIIEKEVWEKVQQKVDSKQIAPRAQSSPHLLGGLLKCGNCGSGMSIGWSGSKNKRYRVYRCSANKNKGTCTSKQYRADDVEKWFLEGLRRLSNASSQDINVVLRSKVNSNVNTSFENKLKKAKERYKRKVEAFTAGLIELIDLKNEKKSLDLLTQEIQTKPKQNESIKEELPNIKKITNIIDAIKNNSVKESKQIISTLIEKVIVVSESKIEIVIHNQ